MIRLVHIPDDSLRKEIHAHHNARLPPAGAVLVLCPNAPAVKCGILLVAVGGIAGIIRDINRWCCRTRRKRRKGPQSSPPASHEVESGIQEFRIMPLQDSGLKHYENLPPEIRRKSILGGAMLDKQPPSDEEH